MLTFYRCKSQSDEKKHLSISEISVCNNQHRKKLNISICGYILNQFSTVCTNEHFKMVSSCRACAWASCSPPSWSTLSSTTHSGKLGFFISCLTLSLALSLSRYLSISPYFKHKHLINSIPFSCRCTAKRINLCETTDSFYTPNLLTHCKP